MARNQNKVSKGAKEGRKYERQRVLAPLFKKGYSYRQMRDVVMQELNLKAYSLQTVKADIDSLLTEWREQRIEDVDKNIQLELTRIDELVKEAWTEWEKSKHDEIECGDPRFIDTINKLLVERRKLLGLYAPDKTVSMGSTNITVGKDMSIAEMEKEINRLQRLDTKK